MCGLVAQLHWNPAGDCGESTFSRMLATLQQRGPDDSSTYFRGPIRLGHTRLSIIDLEGGRQPIFNEQGDIACVFNGEIYNFRELRSTLQEAGHHFATRTDTEVLVHGYEQWGESLFAKLVGMFAIVIADFKSDSLIVARDRMGEKPLYMCFGRGFFACASEAKTLRLHPLVSNDIDVHALSSVLALGYVESTESIYGAIRRLEPGSYVVVRKAHLRSGRYWANVEQRPIELRGEELHEAIRDRLDAAVRSQLIADVPLGVFLSGGIDSSAVTAFAARHVTGRLKTFAVGFEREQNELPFARMVADRYSTDHTEIMLPNDVKAMFDDVCDYVDEPFVDSSLFPTFAVSRAARKHVKVVLTGDGGDELFAGYPSYLDMLHFSKWRLLRGLSRLTHHVSTKFWRQSTAIDFYGLSPDDHAYNEWLSVRSLFDASTIQKMLPEASGERAGNRYQGHVPMIARDALSEALRFDLNSYLPDDLLRKVDTAAMANSLETRAPFLDRDLVEFMIRVPSVQKVSGYRTKGLLRDAMRPLLPDAVVDRPKHGFGGPVASWLQFDLVDHVRELSDLRAEIWHSFNRVVVRSIIDESMRNLRSDWRAPSKVWALLMLDQWSRRHQQ